MSFCLFVWRLWNLSIHSLRGSTWRRAGDYRIDSDTLVYWYIFFGQYQKSHESIVTVIEQRPEFCGPPCALLNQDRVAQGLFTSFSYSSSLHRLRQDECSHLWWAIVTVSTDISVNILCYWRRVRFFPGSRIYFCLYVTVSKPISANNIIIQATSAITFFVYFLVFATWCKRDPSLTMTQFCTHLKTFLFRRAYYT